MKVKSVFNNQSYKSLSFRLILNLSLFVCLFYRLFNFLRTEDHSSLAISIEHDFGDFLVKFIDWVFQSLFQFVRHKG